MGPHSSGIHLESAALGVCTLSVKHLHGTQPNKLHAHGVHSTSTSKTCTTTTTTKTTTTTTTTTVRHSRGIQNLNDEATPRDQKHHE